MPEQDLPIDDPRRTYKHPASALRVSVDGPDPGNEAREREQQSLGGTTLTTWCRGDVDFLPDGSLFIRNPYLANAIERQLEDNHRRVAAGERSRYRDPTGAIVHHPRFWFRLVRDEGFSGPPMNIVC